MSSRLVALRAPGTRGAEPSCRDPWCGIVAGVSGYVPQADDVTEAVDRAVFDGLRALTPLQRLQLGVRASQAVHRLSVAGLRLRFPEAGDEELERRAGALRVGPALLRRLLGREAERWLS